MLHSSTPEHKHGDAQLYTQKRGHETLYKNSTQRYTQTPPTTLTNAGYASQRKFTFHVIYSEVSVDRNTATETKTLKQNREGRTTGRNPMKTTKNPENRQRLRDPARA